MKYAIKSPWRHSATEIFLSTASGVLTAASHFSDLCVYEHMFGNAAVSKVLTSLTVIFVALGQALTAHFLPVDAAPCRNGSFDSSVKYNMERMYNSALCNLSVCKDLISLSYSHLLQETEKSMAGFPLARF